MILKANDPPEIISVLSDATFANQALPGDTVTLTTVFTDPNAGNSHTASIDWGDGTVTAGVVDQQAGTVMGTHQYSSGGIVIVTVTVTDNLGAAAIGTATAVVSGVQLTDNGEL